MKNMNRLCLLIGMVFLAALTAFAQEKTEKRIIEVTGSAETLITPNEFTFKITLLERIENKQKLTIEMQETKLRDELTNLGVDVAKDLTIFDLNSFIFRAKRSKIRFQAKIIG